MCTKFLLYSVEGEDYEATTLQIVIPAGTMNNGFTCDNTTVTVLDDYIVEYTETFRVTLDSVYPPCPIGQPNSSTVYILDDDSRFTSNIPSYSLYINCTKECLK